MTSVDGIKVPVKADVDRKSFGDAEKAISNTADSIRNITDDLSLTGGQRTTAEVRKDLLAVEREYERTYNKLKKEAEDIANQAFGESLAHPGDQKRFADFKMAQDAVDSGSFAQDDEGLNSLVAEAERLKQEYKEAQAYEARLNADAKIQKDLKAQEKAEVEALKIKTKELEAREKAREKTNRAIKSSIGGTIKSIAKMSLAVFGVQGAFTGIRSIVSQITSQNEELSNQLSSIKGALASAFEPALKTIVDWASRAFQYVSALIKALTGIDVIANYNAKALKKQADATASASKASLSLAGFDEINKVDDNSGGGGGGAGASLLADDLDTSAFTAKIEELKQKVADIWNSEPVQAYVEYVKTAFNWTIEGAKQAGLGFASGFSESWPVISENFSNGTSNLLNTWTSFCNTLTATLNKYMPTITSSFFTTFESIGRTVGSFVELVSSIWEGLCQTIADLWDEYGADIVDKFGAFVAKIQQLVQSIQTNIIEPILVPIFNAVTQLWKEHIQPLVTELGGIVASIISLVLSVKTKALDPIINEVNKLRPIIEPIMTSIANTISDKVGKIVDFFTKMVKAVRLCIDAITAFTNGDVPGAMSKGKEAIRTALNAILSHVENTLNRVVSGFNRVTSPFRSVGNAVGKLFGISGAISPLSGVSLPRLYTGAIVNQPTPVWVGDRGAEGVVPLTNESAMNDLGRIIGSYVQGSGGEFIIPIYLDSKLISKKTISYQEAKNFATNGGKY